MNTTNSQATTENSKKRKHQEISCPEGNRPSEHDDQAQTFEKPLKAPKKEENTPKAAEPKITINLPNLTLTSPSFCITHNSLNSNNLSFAEKIKNKMLVVDKTDLLYNLARLPEGYLAIGPKRCGKTFHISTLEAIFKEGKEWWETNCSHLDILKNHHYEFPKTPVIKFDFNDVVGFEELRESSFQCVETLLHEYHLEEQLKYYGKSARKKYYDAISLLERVAEKIAENTGKSLAILIDGYDEPVIRQAQDMMRKSISLKDVQCDREIRQMADFIEVLLMRIKSLRARDVDSLFGDCGCAGFTYVTGTVSICQGGLFYGPDLLDIRMMKRFAKLFEYSEEDAAKLSLHMPQQCLPSIFEDLW